MADNVRALRGTHPERAASKRGQTKVRLPPSVPVAPSELSAEGRAEWDRIVPTLDAKGLLASVDRAVIVLYCSAWSHAVEAEELLRSGGLVTEGQKGNEVRSPVWMIWREAANLAAALAKELLLTPNARLRATMPEVVVIEGADLLD